MSDGDQFVVKWIDRRREPQCAPDPKYPRGVIIDTSDAGVVATCSVEVPYPAKRCGVYAIRCTHCDQSVAVTTTGRPDDPRVVKLGCYQQKFRPGGKVVTHPRKEAHP